MRQLEIAQCEMIAHCPPCAHCARKQGLVAFPSLVPNARKVSQCAISSHCAIQNELPLKPYSFHPPSARVALTGQYVLHPELGGVVSEYVGQLAQFSERSFVELRQYQKHQVSERACCRHTVCLRRRIDDGCDAAPDLGGKGERSEPLSRACGAGRSFRRQQREGLKKAGCQPR